MTRNDLPSGELWADGGLVRHNETRQHVRQRLDAREAGQERDRRLAQYVSRRARYLPRQIENARLKLVHLEREAARLGVVV